MSRPAPGDFVHYRTPSGCYRGIVTGRAGDQAVMQLENQPDGITLPCQRPDGVVYAALGLPITSFTYHSERGCDDDARTRLGGWTGHGPEEAEPVVRSLH